MTVGNWRDEPKLEIGRQAPPFPPQNSVEGQKAKFDIEQFKKCIKKLFNVFTCSR